MMNWQLLQGLPRLHPMSAGIGLAPRDPEKDKWIQIIDGWMDGIEVIQK